MNRLHRESVAQNKGDTLALTQIGEPVPGEKAFARDDEIVTLRGDAAQKRLGRRGQILVDQDRTALIQDTDVQRPRM